MVACVTYAPSLRSGFRFVDDYTYLYWAGTMSISQYLEHTWNPWMQVFNFRPLKRTLVLLEYNLFRSESSYYHLVQILIHSINALLVLEMIKRFSKRWRLAFLAALFFAGFPVVSEAVFWISDEAVLATCFSLLAVLFWITYLQNRKVWDAVFAISALLLAFLSKESSIIVPVVFFLIDRVLIAKQSSMAELVRRYAVIILITLVYLGIEYIIQRQGMFVVVGGYAFGLHVFTNYVAYLAMSLFPWGLPPFDVNVVAVLCFLLFCLDIILKRDKVLGFLLIVFTLAIGPVVLSPQGAYGRYLYLAAAPLAILWGLAFESLLVRWNYGWVKLVTAGMIFCWLILNAVQVAETIAELSEVERQKRVPFADIMRQHRTFPPNTRLFLVEPPFDLATPELAGMFFLRYGTNVSVGSTYDDGRIYTGGILKSERANLQDYATSYVYYFDEMNHPVQVPTDRETVTQTNVALPCDFQVPIRLEGYEITSSMLKRNEPMVVILYWRATGQIEKNYTVFVHLVNADGKIVTSHDGYPRNGEEKTSLWRINQFTADAHVLFTPADAEIKEDYRLEVGLYHLPTLERLSVICGQEQKSDHVRIFPFAIVE